MLRSVDPTTGKLIEEVPEHTEAEVDAALAAARAAFATWRETSFGDRAARLATVAAHLRAHRDRYALLMTEEMGKPIAQAESEVEKCAWVCEHYAENGARFLEPEPIATEAGKSYVRYDPLGPILALMPWNFPFWQVFRFAAPALAAGNVVLLKHASNVPRCAIALEEILAGAGFPTGAFTTLLVGSDAVERVIRHSVIAGVTLTGSDGAGAKVAAAAGTEVKKTVLELGGSDPFIVLEDADVDAAARVAVEARIVNNGQNCIAAKRFIAVEAVAREFETRFAQRTRALRVGDPRDRAMDVGPLARADLVDALDRQVRDSVAAGARIVTGGERLDRPGFFYAPTLLADVRPGAPAFDEETFGPAAALVAARDADEAIALANSSRYGLGAAVWTRDTRRGEEVARALEAGVVFVNGMVKSDPRLPFGGVKRSGYGRELGEVGIREFTNVKSVWVA